MKVIGLKAEHGEGYQEIQKGADGKLRCPRGFLLRKIDANTYRCDGGYHEYRMDDQSMILDKFGNWIVKRDADADSKEA
jgi:hypothetical protein